MNIPVALHPAATSNELSFKLLDQRNFSPVHYRRVNEKTGEEVPWEEIIKGYEYEKGEYVALTDADFEKANVKATHAIEITDFVDAAEISPIYYEQPYYLEPLKGGEKSYALLRDVMQRTGKIAIGKIVIRSRQHLAVVMPLGRVLVAILLRYPHELRDPKFDFAEEGSKASANEIKMAERLVESMADKWKPQKYRDDYHDDLMQLIEKKVKTGQTKTINERPPKTPAVGRGKVINIMDLLKRSVERAEKKDDATRRRKAS